MTLRYLEQVLVERRTRRLVPCQAQRRVITHGVRLIQLAVGSVTTGSLILSLLAQPPKPLYSLQLLGLTRL